MGLLVLLSLKALLSNAFKVLGYHSQTLLKTIQYFGIFRHVLLHVHSLSSHLVDGSRGGSVALDLAHEREVTSKDAREGGHCYFSVLLPNLAIKDSKEALEPNEVHAWCVPLTSSRKFEVNC